MLDIFEQKFKIGDKLHYVSSYSPYDIEVIEVIGVYLRATYDIISGVIDNDDVVRYIYKCVDSNDKLYTLHNEFQIKSAVPSEKEAKLIQREFLQKDLTQNKETVSECLENIKEIEALLND